MLRQKLSGTLNGVDATINYLANAPSNNISRWLQYYVNDKSRSTMLLAARTVHIRDARPAPPSALGRN